MSETLLSVLLFCIGVALPVGLLVSLARWMQAASRRWEVVVSGTVRSVTVNEVPSPEMPGENGFIPPPVVETTIVFTNGNRSTITGDHASHCVPGESITVLRNGFDTYRIERHTQPLN